MAEKPQKGNPAVLVRLEPAVLEKLQELAGGTTHGRAGGVALIVRKIVYEYLGMELPAQYGDKNRQKI